MKDKITAWIIHTGGAFEKVTIDNTLEAMQQAVGGGYIQVLSLTHKEGRPMAHGYCNEEGKLKNMPVNAGACFFFARFGRHSIHDPIVGPVIIVGDDDEGNEDDAPAWIEEAIASLAHPVEV